MKITKKQPTSPVLSATQDVTDKYNASIDYIKSAINSLGVDAKGDKVAQDAIANLSVILFDLQNHNS